MARSAAEWAAQARILKDSELSRAKLFAWYAAGAAIEAGDTTNPFDQPDEFPLAEAFDWYLGVKKKALDEVAARQASQAARPPITPERRIVTNSPAYAEQYGGVELAEGEQ